MSKIVGQKIVRVRQMSKEEMVREGWDRGSALALELENGTIIFASCDPESNGPGELFAHDAKGRQFSVREGG